jgi:hypothetical protein
VFGDDAGPWASYGLTVVVAHLFADLTTDATALSADLVGQRSGVELQPQGFA